MGRTGGRSRSTGVRSLTAALTSVVIVASLSTGAPAQGAPPSPAAIPTFWSGHARPTATQARSSFRDTYHPVARNGTTPPAALLRPPARPHSPAITGAVTAAAGGGAGLGGVVVDVFDRNRKLVDRVSTTANGTYTVPGVTPSRSYYLCFDARKATGGNSTTGYASQCYREVAWSVGAEPPRVTTPVPVPAAGRASGINASLVTGGSISGRVTAAAGGVGLKGVTVELFDSGARRVARVTTASTGTYSFSGVAPSAVGYRVCVDATNRTGRRSNARYLSECYKGVRWSKGSSPPAGVTAVPVSSAATVFGIDVGVLSAP